MGERTLYKICSEKPEGQSLLEYLGINGRRIT
jgi:hypothetical protein